MKQLQSFHNKKQVKEKYLIRLQHHYQADEIIHGVYWEGGKGCAVGCTIHSGNHDCYEKELGLPEWLARLEDTLFEGLPNDKAKEFPIRFLKAIPIGITNKDFDRVKHQFFEFCLTKICKNTDHPTIQNAMKLVISLHQRCIEKGNKSVTDQEWSAAWSAARSAARSAAESAWSAAESAWSAAYIESSEKLLELLQNTSQGVGQP